MGGEGLAGVATAAGLVPLGALPLDDAGFTCRSRRRARGHEQPLYFALHALWCRRATSVRAGESVVRPTSTGHSGVVVDSTAGRMP